MMATQTNLEFFRVRFYDPSDPDPLDGPNLPVWATLDYAAKLCRENGMEATLHLGGEVVARVDCEGRRC